MKTRAQRRHANKVKKEKYERGLKARKKLYSMFSYIETATDKEIGPSCPIPTPTYYCYAIS